MFNPTLAGCLAFCTLLLTFFPAFANVPGGGTNGPNVTLTDNGNGTVTMANGNISLIISKTSAQISTINYTFNNTGSPQTLNLVSGNPNGGKLYWENSNNQGLTFTYSVVSNPQNNGGNYAEVSLASTTVANVLMEVHYSMTRGATGFYVTPIFIHRSIDGAFSMGECRDNIYAGSIFNWMSVDAARNRLMSVASGSVAVGKLGAPVEVSLWTNGIYVGQYEDKYKYGADFGLQRVWGWSSVGTGGKNVGLWNVLGSAEFYNGGPMKRELMSHIGTTILNMINGGHYGSGGQDADWDAGEVWSKVYGPYLIYCNNITNSITATNQAAQALYSDALAQAAAEQEAWPYYWFTNANYVNAAGRGTVTGQIAINDAFNPNASASNLWVGLVQQPVTSSGTYDFQNWVKPYQFWVKTDSDGNFTIPNVIAGGNYTLYAFGPGAAGTFQSQSQTGGNTPNSIDIPASPFSVTVTGGATNSLGAVTWTPTRVGPTVFEIGFPDRTAAKFKHGDDWWVGDIGPGPTNPLPVWSKWLEYPFDYPSGPTYVVGKNRWTTDWNFIQPVVTDSAGNYVGSTSTINFNLPTNATANASLYIALSSDFQGPLIVRVNGNDIAGVNGYFPNYSGSGNGSDVTIREANHGIYSDARLGIASTFLQKGANTITLNMRKGGSFNNHAMYDYLRLELPGYVPPPPTNVAAYAGNNCNLVCWPVMPGATSYNLLRSLSSGSNYVSLTNGVTGPVCGSGWNNATFLDTNVANGTTYYYVVKSVNPVGSSTNSAQAGATPDGAVSTAPPPAPTGLNVASSTHQSVTLNWNSSADADFYTVYRSTLVNNGGGVSNVLQTIVLANNVTNATYTDTSPTDGSIYSYYVTATSAGGTSANSISVPAVPLPAPPASAPASLTGSYIATNSTVLLNWSAVSGAVGYIIRQGAATNGPFVYIENLTQTTYTDTAVSAGTYYYQVTAVNAGGVSTGAVVKVVAPPVAPVTLAAVAGDSQIVLTWSAVANATGYYLKRGLTSSNENVTVLANYSDTSYTNTGLANGTTYYYVVAATNAGGLGPNSPEAGATPSSTIFSGPRNLVWKGDGSANNWDISAAVNWLSNTTATTFSNGDAVTFDAAGSNNVPVNLVGILQPALVTVTNPLARNYTFSGTGSISGTNKLVKMGAGALTLTAANSYTGGTIVSNGLVTFSSGATIPASGTLSLFNTGSVVVVTASSLPNVLVNGTNAITGNGNSGTGIAALDVEGMLTLLVSGGSKVFDLTGSLTGGGTLVLGNPSAMSLRFNGTGGDGSAIFNLGTAANFASVRNNANAIALGGLAGGPLTTLQGNSSFATTITYTIGGANANTEFDGVLANGSFSGNPPVVVVKTGTGRQTFTNANTYSGGTTINAGSLQINNLGGSGTGSGAVAVGPNGTLGGSGIISGAVTVNSGGTLAPGNPFGTLTISNNLTLAGNSTTLMQIQHAPATNSRVKVSGTLFAGGTLNVTNTGASSLANGDSFTLFSTPAFSGNFTNIILPPLTGNLLWNTNTLVSSGTISVVLLTPPEIANLQTVNGNLTFSGSGGVSGWPYYVLSTTNLSAVNWSRVATNQFDASGNFSLTLTNVFDPGQPQTFYKLQLQ